MMNDSVDKLEELEEDLIEALIDDNYNWTKVPLDSGPLGKDNAKLHPSQAPMITRYYVSSDHIITSIQENHWVNQLLTPSEENVNYKMTQTMLPEVEIEEEEEVDVRSGPGTFVMDTLSTTSSTKRLTPELSGISFDNVQILALRSLINLGIDIENTYVLNKLEPTVSVVHFDWEAIITRNAYIPLLLTNSHTYPRDRSRRNAADLSRVVRKFIERVFALKHIASHGVDIKDIQALKQYVQPLSENVEKFQETVGKLVARLSLHEDQVKYIVLPDNITLGDLENNVRKHFVKEKSSKQRKHKIILSDEQQVYQNYQQYIREINPNYLSKADDQYQIISLHVEILNTEDQNNENKTAHEPDEACKRDNTVKGYRNTKINLSYYNACTQTVRASDLRKKGLVSRQSQTPAFPLLEKTSDTMKTKATQMEREDHYIDEKNDRILCPAPYQATNPEEDLIREVMATRIQRKLRKYLVKDCEREVKDVMANLKKNEYKLKNMMQEGECLRQMSAMLSPMFLNRRQDFYMLYVFLHNWWQKYKNNDEHKCAVDILKTHQRTSCNDLNKSRASQFLKQEFKELLKNMVNIEKLATEAKKPDLKEIAELEETAKPLTLNFKTKAPITISTVESQRGTQLKELYETLRRRDLSIEERIDFLLHIDRMLKNHRKELELTDRLLCLIHKEIDYLSHSIAQDKIETLRQRIELHFLKYIRSRDINPNMNKILDRRYPPDCGPNLLQCDHCFKVKHINKFQTESFSDTVLPTCKSCFYLRVIGCKPEDHSKYSSMLQQLREEELKYCTLSPVPFLINESTVHYLVSNVWASQSPISHQTDLIKLKLARWILHLDWTPWNNIVLTEEEYECHVNVKHVYSFYSASFIHKVQRRNLRAKMHFHNLYKLEHYMKSIYWLQDDTITCQQDEDQEAYEKCL